MIPFLVGALCYRIRGGLIDDIIGREISNGYIRAVWALNIAFFFFLKTQVIWSIPLVLMLAFCGACFGYWGKFDLSLKENRNFKNYALLTLDGMKMIAPVCIFSLMFPQLLWLLAAGAMWVPFAFAGIFLAKHLKFQGHTQWAEYLLGGAVTQTLWMVL
jgi:hypothetical protein